VKVYATVCIAIIGACIGSALHLQYHIGGMLTHIASFALIAMIAADRSQSSFSTTSEFWTRRVSLLAAFGVVQGCSIGPLIDMALYVQPAAILAAFILTASIFICFTVTALCVPRRSTFAFASLLSSSLSFLCILSLFSLFVPSFWAYKLQLYLGLLVFSGYILLDTQRIIERAEDGQTSGDVYVDDALSLFTNIVAIFVRILIILVENSQKRQRERPQIQVKRR